LQLNAVYSAWWFLLILAFLVVSTSLCIARNTPKSWRISNYKENIREQSLRAFHHKAEADGRRHRSRGPAHWPACWPAAAGRCVCSSATPPQARHRLDGGRQGGAANKIGYIAAHSAIVLVCVGGLLDGDLIVRAQMWLGGKTPYAGGGLIADVKPEHRLSSATPPSVATCWWPKARSRARPS
jgi:cytochrome c biogenesis protein